MEFSRTENNAVAYATSGNPFVDFNFSITKLRDAESNEIFEKFSSLLNTDRDLAIQYLTFVRNPRTGLGEKRIFREIILNLCKEKLQKGADEYVYDGYHMDNGFNKFFTNLFHYMGQNGSWKDVFWILSEILDLTLSLDKSTFEESLTACYYGVTFFNDCIGTIARMFNNYSELSLSDDNHWIMFLPKYMPTEKASNTNSKVLYKLISSKLNCTPKEYRKALGDARKRLNIVEQKMCTNKWGEIEYNTVPSKANLLYTKAFERHDPERRSQYLKDVKAGKCTINGSLNFPHEIYHKIKAEKSSKENLAYEMLWQNLTDFVGDNNTIVVVDGSASMEFNISKNSSVEAIDVARALGIYYAEHLKGEFHNKFIEFSHYPKLIELPDGSLAEKKLFVERFTDCSNTNIYKVMKLILDTAKTANLKPEEIPNILIISDMQFDEIDTDKVLFDSIKKNYQKSGYIFPKIIFWNLDPRQSDDLTIPMTVNKKGIQLVSGYSTTIANMVIKNQEPFDFILDACSKYDSDESVKNFISVL